MTKWRMNSDFLPREQQEDLHRRLMATLRQVTAFRDNIERPSMTLVAQDVEVVDGELREKGVHRHG